MFKPQPMYVSRAVSRAYGTEHPIDDPFGGPAYGERNKGGSVGKVFSSVVPMVAGAAMMIGSGGMMAPMLIGGAMFAGGAMSGIGAITGNQTLSKIGGITSAVAGVAGIGYSIYNSEWMTNLASKFSSGAELTTTAGTGAEAGNAMANIPGMGWKAAAAEGATIPGVGEAANFLQQGTQAAFNPASVSGAYGGLLGPGGSTIPGVTPGTSFVTPNSLLNSGSAPMTVANTSMGSSLPANTGASSNFLQNFKYVPPAVTPPPPTDGGLLSSAGQFIKDNPVVSLMGLQTLSGLAEGASPKSQAEGEYIQAMTQLKEAETNYINSGKSAEAETEFNRAKAYEEEKRKAYNDSIIALQNPQTQNLAQTMYGGAQTGLINQARA